MRRSVRWLLITVSALLVVALVGPFLIPITPLPDTQTPQALADADSRFIEANGLTVHYKTMGQGEPVFVLLHGFGASTFSWREVMEPLSHYGTVIAFDRPGFGLTSRPLPGQWTGQNPYSPDAQTDITVALMDKLGVDKAILVGNSAGGTTSVLTALRHPQRVEALILVSPAVYIAGGAPGWVQPLLALPQVDRIGPLLVRSVTALGSHLGNMSWYNPSRLTPEMGAGYSKPLRADNWDHALWQIMRAGRDLDLPARLVEITMPVLVITGDHDRIVPTTQSIRLAEELPDAMLMVIPETGHVAHEESPAIFLQAVDVFVNRLQQH